jgi:hypothetical protein
MKSVNNVLGRILKDMMMAYINDRTGINYDIFQSL